MLSKRNVFHICIFMCLIVGALYSFSGVYVSASLHNGLGRTGAMCPLGSPMAVKISNYTLRRVSEVTIQIEGWRNKITTNILSVGRLIYPVVVEPFESVVACYQDEAFRVPLANRSVPDNGSGFAKVDTDGAIREIQEYNKLAKGVELVVVDVKVENK